MKKYTLKNIASGECKSDIEWRKGAVAGRILMAISTDHDFYVVFRREMIRLETGHDLGWGIYVYSPKGTYGMYILIDHLNHDSATWGRIAECLRLQFYNQLLKKFVAEEQE